MLLLVTVSPHAVQRTAGVQSIPLHSFPPLVVGRDQLELPAGDQLLEFLASVLPQPRRALVLDGAAAADAVVESWWLDPREPSWCVRDRAGLLAPHEAANLPGLCAPDCAEARHALNRPGWVIGCALKEVWRQLIPGDARMSFRLFFDFVSPHTLQRIVGAHFAPSQFFSHYSRVVIISIGLSAITAWKSSNRWFHRRASAEDALEDSVTRRRHARARATVGLLTRISRRRRSIWTAAALRPKVKFWK